MKKCPNCDRKFDDSMRFCQSDGTPLVEDAPPVDPYKTMVASKEEISAAFNSSAGPSDTESSMKIDEEVLQLPQESDPKKTMFVSEDELRREMGEPDEPVMDLPPLAPDPPKFSEPELSPPSFGDPAPAAPPPSPFSSSANEPIANPTAESPFSKTTPPIPSPFDRPKPAAYDQPASFEPVSDPEPISSQSEPSQFESASAPIEASASGSVQDLENNEPMQNAPYSSAPAAAGQNKTLAIVSLVAGILGLTICCGTLLPSLLGIVLGFMAKGKATNDPANFGGKGLALGGIITGVIGLLAGVAYLIFVFFLGGMQMIMQNAQ